MKHPLCCAFARRALAVEVNELFFGAPDNAVIKTFTQSALRTESEGQFSWSWSEKFKAKLHSTLAVLWPDLLARFELKMLEATDNQVLACETPNDLLGMSTSP